MANEWYYSKSGQRFGPVSGQQLKELAAKGGIGSDDLVWKEGMPQWVHASKVKGLMPSSGTNSTQPPPVPALTSSVETQPPAQAPVGKLDTFRTATFEKAQAVLGKAKSIWSKLSYKQRLLVGSFGGVLVLLVFIWLFSGGMPRITADDLAAQVQANPDRAMSRYKGKVVQVTGQVASTGKRSYTDDKGEWKHNSIYNLGTNPSINVQCDTKDYSEAASGMVGKTLVFRGLCYGITPPARGDRDVRRIIWIKDCELVSSSSPVASGKGNANTNSAYDSGYQEGLSLGNEYVRRLQGMAPAAQNEFRKVYADELRTHERNRDDVIRAYGAENNNAQNKKGFCDGLREALQKAGIN